VRLRPDLDLLPSYAASTTPVGAARLASNEVDATPPPAVLAAVERAIADVNRYPDFGANHVRERLAHRLGVTTGQVAVGCGSVSLCQQLVQICCRPGDEVVFAWRSFEAYPIVTRIVGASPKPVPLDADWSHDLGALAAAVTPSTRLVFLCSPNNPTGGTIGATELSKFLASVPEHVLVVLDEAYREFVTDPTAPDGVDVARTTPNVVALRTFSKAYRLAGLRLGYCVAAEPIVTALNKVQIPYSVNTVAQAAAVASLDASGPLLRRCAEIVIERDRVRAELAKLGFATPRSQANFLWLPLGTRTAGFATHCLRNRVVVRSFDGEGVRVTVGASADNDAFLAAARTFT